MKFPNQACPVGVLAVLFPSSWEVKKLAFLGGIAEGSRLDCMAGARHARAHGPWPRAHGPWPRAHEALGSHEAQGSYEAQGSHEAQEA